MKIRKRTKKLIFSTMLSFCLALSFVVPVFASYTVIDIFNLPSSVQTVDGISYIFYDISSVSDYGKWLSKRGDRQDLLQIIDTTFSATSSQHSRFSAFGTYDDSTSTNVYYLSSQSSSYVVFLTFDFSISISSSYNNSYSIPFYLYTSSSPIQFSSLISSYNSIDKEYLPSSNYIDSYTLSLDSIPLGTSYYSIPLSFTVPSSTALYFAVSFSFTSVDNLTVVNRLSDISFSTTLSAPPPSPSFSGNDIFSLPYTENGTVGDSDYSVDYALSNVTEYNQGWVQDGRGSFADQQQNGLFFDNDIYSDYVYPDSIYGQTAYSWGTVVDDEYSSHLFYWTDKPRSCAFDLKINAGITAFDEDHWNRSSNIYLAMYLSRVPLRASEMIARTGTGMYYFQQPAQTVMYSASVKLEQLLWDSSDPYPLIQNFRSDLVSFGGVPTYISFGIIVSNTLYDSNISYPSVFESGIDVSSLSFRVYNYDPSDNSYIDPDADIPTPTPRPENPDIGDIYDQNEELDNTLTKPGETPVFDGDHINDYFIDNANDNIDNMIRPFNGFLGTIEGCITWFQQMWKTLLQSEIGFPDTFSPFYLLTPAAIVLILRSVLGR